jgi:hypothetical protein
MRRRQYKIGRNRGSAAEGLAGAQDHHLGSRPGIGQRFRLADQGVRGNAGKQQGKDQRRRYLSGINDRHGPFELLRVPTFGTKWNFWNCLGRAERAL